MRSIDEGITWTFYPPSELNTWLSVAYGNGVWVAVSSTGTNRVMRNFDISQNYTLTGTGTTSDTSAIMTYNDIYLGI
jgi:hypothetical protein